MQNCGVQTLTFEHRGWGATHEQKARSPLVVPLGAIGSVEYERRRFNSWFRVVPRGHDAWDESAHSNPHGLTCGVDPTEFAERVKSAVSKRRRPTTRTSMMTICPGPHRERVARSIGQRRRSRSCRRLLQHPLTEEWKSALTSQSVDNCVVPLRHGR